MTNNENKNELRSKEALKAVFSSIQKNTIVVLDSANKSVRSFGNAYQAVTSDVSCGIIKTFNYNLKFLESVLDKTQIEFVKEIPYKNSEYEKKFNYGQLIPLVTECTKILI